MRGVDYIEHNIDQELTLAKVAAKSALSEHHFHRLFRARFGMPVMDYVRRRRITQAATALLWEAAANSSSCPRESDHFLAMRSAEIPW